MGCGAMGCSPVHLDLPATRMSSFLLTKDTTRDPSSQIPCPFGGSTWSFNVVWLDLANVKARPYKGRYSTLGLALNIGLVFLLWLINLTGKTSRSKMNMQLLHAVYFWRRVKFEGSIPSVRTTSGCAENLWPTLFYYILMISCSMSNIQFNGYGS